MGMDVYGRAPSSEVGEYFRSSIWTWPSIIEAIVSVGVLDRELVESMCYNDGKGPDAEQAVALADALEAAYHALPPDSVFVSDDSPFTDVGTASAGRPLSQMFGLSEPDFSADVAFILEFARFARHSGGFEVW